MTFKQNSCNIFKTLNSKRTLKFFFNKYLPTSVANIYCEKHSTVIINFVYLENLLSSACVYWNQSTRRENTNRSSCGFQGLAYLCNYGRFKFDLLAAQIDVNNRRENLICLRKDYMRWWGLLWILGAIRWSRGVAIVLLSL